MIILNLAVADLARSTAFYTGLGFALHPAYSSVDCSCVTVSEAIVVMLLTRDRFADFTTGPVADPRDGTAAIICLSAGSRAEVDDLVARALRLGGRPWLETMADGPMYGHSFADPDGHVWELLSMQTVS